ncbi:MAG: hypothetical protein COW01_11825 [Bdellovibrionales bacterium CG12_big_fil_rev_8_21_14_0_65_38_15]|nr:MAG: hypothetical protein COW79_01415 [Bdellovibrionales bacterium CG22_combo_CG10-13_8_21_14_all_38_13]PIQ54022.1 MAG: hypothetical protein COW01_11825 [Bdellovibrionales bacterium CG12_big_fil_rev_8_21_14_0_65_38_15]PIR29713.1 MAG: hypothetical protein COV38_09280 [Bdellovibrionales bacterium CG11_big_fil_rev_8_21_14_0_20_38_13]
MFESLNTAKLVVHLGCLMLTKINSMIFYLGDSSPCQSLIDLCSEQVLDLKEFQQADQLLKGLKVINFENDKVVVLINKDFSKDDKDKINQLFSILNVNRSKVMICSAGRDIDTFSFDNYPNLLHLKGDDFAKDCAATIVSFFGDHQYEDVVLDGNLLSGLTCKQKALIRLFLSREDREIERHDILVNVWGDMTIQPKTVDVHLYNLRRKIHRYGYLIRSEGGGRWKLLSERIDQNDS